MIVVLLLKALQRLREESRLTMVLVEQHARLALEFSPRAIILDRGKIVYDGASEHLVHNPQELSDLIGVAG